MVRLQFSVELRYEMVEMGEGLRWFLRRQLRLRELRVRLGRSTPPGDPGEEGDCPPGLVGAVPLRQRRLAFIPA